MQANFIYYCLMLLLLSTIASAQLSELTEEEKRNLSMQELKIASGISK